MTRRYVSLGERVPPKCTKANNGRGKKAMNIEHTLKCPINGVLINRGSEKSMKFNKWGGGQNLSNDFK